AQHLCALTAFAFSILPAGCPDHGSHPERRRRQENAVAKVNTMAGGTLMTNIAPGIKVAAQMSPEPAEEDLQFVRQMGVEYVVLWTDGEHANYDYFMSRRELFENAGLKIYGFGNSDVHNQDAIVLNLPNRDEKVA